MFEGTLTYRDHLARALCLRYPDYGCASAFDADDPCHKHQSWYIDLADFFFHWQEDPTAVEEELLRESSHPEEGN